MLIGNWFRRNRMTYWINSRIELEKVSGSGEGYPHKDKEITEQCPTAPSSVLLHQAVSYCTKQCPTAPSRRQQAVTKQCPLLIKQDASLTLLRLLG